MPDLSCVSTGLFVAWAAHDAEEYVTMASSSRDLLARIPEWVPLPADLRERGFSQAHVNLSLALTAAAVAGSAMAELRSNGGSPWFRGGALAFGVHGFGHLAASLATRGYTTGVVTAPLIVLPYWWWARRVLRRRGLECADAATTAVALAALPLTAGVHVIADRALRLFRLA